jgi:hypothetical protein
VATNVIYLSEQPWWTAADRAELELFVHEFVDDILEHRMRCSRCGAGYPPCPWVRAAIERVVEWRDVRVLRSKAVWLRVRQEELDQAVMEQAGRR